MDRKKIGISRRQMLQGVVATTGTALLAPNFRRALGEEDPAGHDEWTFAQAQKFWNPMTRAVQHVGIPGHEWQAGVLWDGALLLGPLKSARENAGMAKELVLLGNNLLHVSVGYGSPARFADRAATPNPAVERSLESGYLPIPHIQTQDGNLTWNEVVYAHFLGRAPEEGMQPGEDDLLVIQIRFRVRNRSSEKDQGHLWLHMGDTSQVHYGYKAGQGNELGQSISHSFTPPFGFVENQVRYVIPPPAKGSLQWHEEMDPPQGMKTRAGKILEWLIPVSAGEEARLDLTIPYRSVSHDIGEKLVDLDRDRSYRETSRFWEGVAGDGGSIVTQESFIDDYAKTVPNQMAQQVGYRHKAHVWMYKTSPNYYEMYWPCNAAKALPSFDLRGLARYSRPVLQSFIDTQTSDFGGLNRNRMGSGDVLPGEGFEKRPGFLGNFGDWTANTLLASHGLELWALASHYRITRDRAWLGNGTGSPLQAILDACDWVLVQRHRTMREENGKKVAHWGLLPAASAHDWLSGNTIFNDAFCIFGIIEAVRMLREVEHPRTEELSHELNDYRACLRERYIEARDRARPLPLPNGSSLPYVPRDVYELDWAKIDWTYTGYGPLRAGAWGALDPHDEMVEQSFAFLEAGMPKGEGFYFGIAKNAFGQPTADENFRDVSDPTAGRHFLWRHYVEYETMWPIGFDLFLQRDDLPRFFEWFFHNFSIVLHQDYRVGVESLDGVPSCAPGDGERWRAIRNMFVNERGGYDGSQQSLWLLQAIPRSWLKPGARMAVNRMGTHFGGQVDLKTEVAKDGKSLRVDAELDLAVLPTEIRMRLRSGNGRPLVWARVNGRKTAVLEKETILLPKETKGEYRIEGHFV